jgi:hypothetical protein
VKNACGCDSKGYGPRCALHSRPNYEVNLAIASKSSPSVSDYDNLLKAATEYADSIEGLAVILKEIEKARKNNQFELEITLVSAIDKAEALKEANKAVIQSFQEKNKKPGTLTSLDGTAPQPIDWSMEVPIWPKTAVVELALKGAKVTASNKENIKKTYNALFKSAWVKKFFPNPEIMIKTPTTQTPPPDNTTGWRWREEATEYAGKMIRGAESFSVEALVEGMIIHSRDHVFRRIKKIENLGELKFAFNGPLNSAKKNTMTEYRISYYDGPPETVPSNHVFIHLPALEEYYRVEKAKKKIDFNKLNPEQKR